MKSLLSLALVLLPTSLASAQGSLTPPGTPAPTMKTLQQIEPRIDLQNAPPSAVTTTDAAYHYIITQPGSYFLSANLGVTKTHGIKIAAEGVTLDLSGFEISRSSGTGGYGIELPAAANRATVRNGSIKSFSYGIATLVDFDNPRACAFRDLSVSGCTSYAILAGTSAVLESCRAHGNASSYVIYAGKAATLTHCTISGNTALVGIYSGIGSSMSHCTASNNTINYAIYADANSVLNHCTASENSGIYGIYAEEGAAMNHCAANLNTSGSTTSAGIYANNGVTLTGCVSSKNVSTVVTSTPTTGMGFRLGSGCTIQSSSAYQNEGDGIYISSDNLVRDNISSRNGSSGDGAGIHAINSDNRIEGNNVTDNDRGIDVDLAGNIIIKNTASGNTTNWDLVANNVYGPIMNRTTPAASLVNGDFSISSSTATTDPWANFSY